MLDRFLNVIFGNTSALELVFCLQRNGSYGKVDAQNYASKTGIISEGQLEMSVTKKRKVFKDANNHAYLDEHVHIENDLNAEIIEPVRTLKTLTQINKFRIDVMTGFRELLAKSAIEMNKLELPSAY